MEELLFVMRDIENTVLDSDRKAYGRDVKSVRVPKHTLRQWNAALLLASKKLVDMESLPVVADIAEA